MSVPTTELTRMLGEKKIIIFTLPRQVFVQFLSSYNQLCSTINIHVTPRDRLLQSPEVLVRKKQMTYSPVFFLGQYCGPSAWCNIIALSHKVWRFIGASLPWRDECGGEEKSILNEVIYSIPFPPPNGLCDYVSYC